MTISSMVKNPAWKRKPFEAYLRMKQAIVEQEPDSNEHAEKICFDIFADMVREFHREQGKKMREPKSG